MKVRDTLAPSLRALAPRERRALGIGLFLAALAALYGFLWDPGIASIRRLDAQLPRLRAEAEQMRSDARRVAESRKALESARHAAAPLALVQATLDADAGLRSAARVRATSSERLALEIAAIDFDQWLALAARLQGEFGIRVERCTVAALSQPGQVRVDAALAAAPGR